MLAQQQKIMQVIIERDTEIECRGWEEALADRLWRAMVGAPVQDKLREI